MTGLLCPSALRQFSSLYISSCLRSAFPSPHSLVRPSSINGKYKTTGIFKTACQLIFSFVFSKRKLERIEGISVSLEGMHISKCFVKKRKKFVFELLCHGLSVMCKALSSTFLINPYNVEEELYCSRVYRWGDWLLEPKSLPRDLEINCSTFGKWWT